MMNNDKNCRSFRGVRRLSKLDIGQPCQFYIPATNSDGYTFMRIVTTTPVEAYAVNGNLIYVETKNTLYILRLARD